MSFFTPTAEELVNLNALIMGKRAGVISDYGVEAAVHRVEQIASTPLSGAALLAQSIIQYHPFTDGNKRTAMLAAALMLNRNWYEIDGQRNFPRAMFKVARGDYDTAPLINELGRSSYWTRRFPTEPRFVDLARLVHYWRPELAQLKSFDEHEHEF